MLTQDFCDFLEYEISALLKNTLNPALKGFWCDGVLLPTFENNYSKKYVNDNRKLLLTAFIGKKEQAAYELTLNLGNKAISKYARDLDISDCMPNYKNDNAFEIDILNQKMFIQLD